MDHRPERQRESTRIDNFVDAAFAFVVTLLVINGAEIPHDVDSLLLALAGVPAFALAFAQMAVFWHGHVDWRELLGLADWGSLLLSLLLVFFALILVYPLHMVLSSALQFLTGGRLPSEFTSDSLQDIKLLFVIYGTTYACMAGTLAMLFLHSARAATAIMDEIRIEAQVRAVHWAFAAMIGVLSMIIALLVPNDGSGWLVSLAGFAYALRSFSGVVKRRWRKRLVARYAPPSEPGR